MTDHFASAELAPVWISLVAGYGIGVLGALAMIVHAWRRAALSEARAREANAAVDADRELREGFASVIGEVEYAEGAPHAVRVEIEQSGSESESSGNWTTRWTEKKRTIRVSPFYIRRRSGDRVRVEPTREAYLVDALDGVIRVDLAKRVRVAQLVPGEQVIAVGELARDVDPEAEPRAGAYRDSARGGWVLRAPAGDRLLLSTESVGARFTRRAAFHRRAALLSVVLFGAIHLGLLSFHARALAGEDRAGTVTRAWTSATNDDDGDVTYHANVLLEVGGAALRDELNHFGATRGDEIPVRWVSVWESASAVGSGPRMHMFFVLALLAAGLISAIAHRVAGSRAVGWYDEKKLVDQRSGRLEGGS